MIRYEHVRNATGKLTYSDTTFLIDPMLAEKGAYPGFAGTINSEARNPLSALPMSVESILSGVDAVIVTHTHEDHWDAAAQNGIPKNMPIFVQNKSDANIISQAGFTDITVLDIPKSFRDVCLTPIEGTHGTVAMYDNPDMAALAGDSIGVVFSSPTEKTTYLMGDTVWTGRVSKTLHAKKPDIVIMNTGYAKVLAYNESIIMGIADVAKAATLLPTAEIVTVHMDAINHCTVSRNDMRNFVHWMHLEKRVHIPNDGETISFDS